jgi:hypothetical protein
MAKILYDPDLPPEYPIEDWLADYTWLCQHSPQVVSDLLDGDTSAFVLHFSETRKNSTVADYCRKRFVAAMTYLQNNLDAVNFGKFGVVGGEKALIAKPVIVTLYRFFVARPDDAVDMPIPRKIFIQELKDTYESR